MTQAALSAPTDAPPARYALTVAGQVYGPYSSQQVWLYVAEGRITASSLISRDGGTWMPASDDPHCAAALAAKAAGTPMGAQAAAQDAPKAAPNSARDAFLKELEGVRSQKVPPFATKPADESRKPAPAPMRLEGGTDEEHVKENANFVLIFDVKSRGHGKLEEDIMSLGKATKVLSGIWVLNGPYTSAAVRNHLIGHFGKLDSFFIIDATRDKLAWFNLGPETDSLIRQVWRRS